MTRMQRIFTDIIFVEIRTIRVIRVLFIFYWEMKKWNTDDTNLTNIHG